MKVFTLVSQDTGIYYKANLTPDLFGGVITVGSGTTYSVNVDSFSVSVIDGSSKYFVYSSVVTNFTGKLYLFGGFIFDIGDTIPIDAQVSTIDEKLSNRLFVCDVSTGWSEIMHSGGPTKRHSSGLTFNAGKLYVLGGATASGDDYQTHDDFWEYTIATNTWRQIN